MKIFLLFVVIFVIGVSVLLIETPVLTGRGTIQVRDALRQTEQIELSGNTLFISDLHLTAQPALEQQFNLDFSDAQNVVIVGDFFHTENDFWSFGGTEEEVFRNVLTEIVPERFAGRIYYIGSTTHDPQNLQTRQISFENFEFFYLGEYGKFRVNGMPMVAYHGQQLHGGFVGGGVSWLLGKIGFPAFLEKLGKDRFGIGENVWVINGHSHVPAIDHQAKVANTGSFVGAPFNKFIWRLHIGTGVLFDDDNVVLQEYEGLNIKQLYPFVF